MNVSKKVLNKILNKKIKPLPKYIFIFKNIIFWLLYIIFLIIGSMSSTIIIFDILNHRFHQVPIIWLSLFISFIIISIFNFKNTKKSYLIPLPLLLLSNLLLSIIIGFLFFNFNLINFSTYKKLSPQVFNSWQQPEAGYLSGTIISIKSPTEYILLDLNNFHWNIFSPYPLKLNSFVKLTGSYSFPNKFTVKTIKPWSGCGCKKQLERKCACNLY